MPSDQTRSAILAAAERLYADRGFGDVTLRDIVAEAAIGVKPLGGVEDCGSGLIRRHLMGPMQGGFGRLHFKRLYETIV